MGQELWAQFLIQVYKINLIAPIWNYSFVINTIINQHIHVYTSKI